MMYLEFSYGLAVSVRIVTLALAALGVVIQRKSHVKNDNKAAALQKSALRRPLWHLGFWIYIFSSVCSDIVGISSLPLLVIALLGTLLLFFNAIFSHFILHEKMTRFGWLGLILVAGASTALAILMHVPDIPKSVDELEELLSRPVYIVYSVITLIAVIVISLITRRCICKRRTLKARAELEPIQTMSMLVTTDGQNSHPLSIDDRLSRLNFWIALLYQCLSTILASLALVFAKISFELLQVSIDTHQNQFKNILSIAILIITIVATILQLVFFNESLRYYPTVFTIPFGFSLGVILACINTMIYFDSFTLINTGQIVAVISCVLVTVLGIYLLR